MDATQAQVEALWAGSGTKYRDVYTVRTEYDVLKQSEIWVQKLDRK